MEALRRVAAAMAALVLTLGAGGGVAQATIWYLDADEDGFGDVHNFNWDPVPPRAWVLNPNDCDDTAPLVHPGAPELCNNRDDDCDQLVDEGCPP